MRRYLYVITYTFRIIILFKRANGCIISYVLLYIPIQSDWNYSELYNNFTFYTCLDTIYVYYIDYSTYINY